MFSEKYSNKPTPILQKNAVDNKLKNDLWNTIQKFYLNKVYYYNHIYGNDPYSLQTLNDCQNKSLIFNLYENFFIIPINNLGQHSLKYIKEFVETKYKQLEWFEIYDFLEFINSSINTPSFKEEINNKLKRNNAAYRFLDNDICPVVDDIEIQEVEKAATTKYNTVNIHIKKSIQLFSDRTAPDYENTIKESITAVEAMCSLIVGNKTTLGSALEKIEKSGTKIHPALKLSFEKLYGYTSDANGIRHSGDIGGPNSTFSEAKFMLVSCSAFVNYLVEAFSTNNP